MASKKAPAVPRRRYADFCNKIGNEPAPFWDGWSRLQKEYDQRLPA
jgi:hypothetical protein